MDTQSKKIKLRIHGMHCKSCEVLIEQKLKKVAGVEKVHADHIGGKVDVVSSQELDLEQLNGLMKEYGYTVSLWGDTKTTHVRTIKNSADDYFEMAWIFLGIFFLYYFLKKFDLVPNFSVSSHMSYGLVFLIGMVAAVSSCIAVVGGLLLALAGKYNELHPNLSGVKKFKPHVYFNGGRIVGYTIFGAMVGALGSMVTLSPSMNGFLMIFVSAVMLILGFQLLHLFPKLQRLTPKMPKFISHKIHELSENENESDNASFTLGALTFFLPCGFTQALQLYVLASGDWKIGALTMLVFSLGTMPALLSLSAITSFAKGAFQKHFMRFAGVLIVMISVFNINNGLTLAGFNTTPSSNIPAEQVEPPKGQTQVQVPTQLEKAPIVDGKQIVKMTVKGYSYLPNRFTVVAGIPVEWQIDGGGAAGCGRVLIMQTLGIAKLLESNGITTITFTPTEAGNIPFNCSMGMMTRNSGFTVVSK